MGPRASRAPSARRRGWLLLSGTPFRSDQCPIPGVRYDDGVADARRLLQLRRRRPRRHLPPGHLRPLRRRAAVAQRRRPRRVVLRRRGHRARGGPALPHGDLPRAGRRPAADPRAGARAPRGGPRRRPPRRGRARRRRRRRARAGGGARCCARRPGATPTVVLHTEARAAEKLAGLHALAPTAGSSRSTWSARASTSPACASASTRRRPRRRSSSARSSGASCARSPAGRSTAAGSSCPPTRSCARTPPRSSASCATSCARRARRTTAALDELDERRETERGEAEAFVPVAADVAPQLALFGGGAPAPAPAPSFPSAVDEPDEATMPRLRAPRAAARQAPPAGGRPAPQPGRQPRRDQPLAEPLVRRAPRRGRVDRAARALDRAAARPSLRQTVNHLSPTG